MLLTILLSVLQAAAAVAAPPPQGELPAAASTALSPSKCPATMHQADGDPRAAARRLDQLSPGRLELTVLRQMGSCPEPVVLREGIGGNPDSPDRIVPERR